ncbi:MAG: hypothetical protein J6U46_02955 [Bacteroidaceae bacterium]|nr:hypothetical protein [Bacteroidaceae bacterium]
MNSEIQFLLYQLPDDEGKIQVVIKDETIWAHMLVTSITPRVSLQTTSTLQQAWITT